MKKWYSVEEIDAHVRVIDERGLNRMYFVVGGDRSLLIDTGWGLGDLKTLVRSLSDLPITVVNTHGHPDHVSGNFYFDKVHIAEADHELMCESFRKETRELKCRTAISVFPESFDKETWCDKKFAGAEIISEGHCFDLGGTVIEVMSVPGHTAGSIALLDHGNGIIFAGDTVLSGEIWMHGERSQPMNVYHESLVRLRDIIGYYRFIVAGHTDRMYDRRILDDLIRFTGQLLSGERKGEPYKTFIGAGLACDFGDVRIVYREDRLF